MPIIHVRHCSIQPGSPLGVGKAGHEFMDLARPQSEELVISKEVNSAFIGTNLLEKLNEINIHRILFVGFTTDHCVSTTARMAANYGYEVLVAADATVSFSKLGYEGTYYEADVIHKVSLASLKDEFAAIVTTQAVLKEIS